jgi:hypothetical protein
MPLHDWNDPAGWKGVRLLWMTELFRHIKAQLCRGAHFTSKQGSTFGQGQSGEPVRVVFPFRNQRRDRRCSPPSAGILFGGPYCGGASDPSGGTAGSDGGQLSCRRAGGDGRSATCHLAALPHGRSTASIAAAALECASVAAAQPGIHLHGRCCRCVSCMRRTLIPSLC